MSNKEQEIKELEQELKCLYSVLEAPSDDWYDPDIAERIETIIKQIHDIHKGNAIKKTA